MPYFAARDTNPPVAGNLLDGVTSFLRSGPSLHLIPYIAAADDWRSATDGEEPNWPEEELPSAHAMPPMASSPAVWSCDMEQPVPPIDRVQQLEETLQECQALALAGQFAAATMHEVNGPLEAITNLNYLVEANADDGEQVRHYSGLIDEQLSVLSTISRQTLSFYHSKETVEAILIAPVAEAALRIHHQKIAAKQIRLLRKLAGDVIVESHPGAMLQVFSNLIGNAVEALPVKGTLQIRARCTEREAHILFADNGCGIPASIRGQIFEPFFSTKKERGTGLGLGIIKAIVERHRGRIRSRTSTQSGRSGTAFRISLPLRAQFAAAK
jgi:signal transduction histidine kinase